MVKEVLYGEINWLDIATLDSWIGGTHLTPDNTWCCDSVAERLVIKC
mgnify:CR=1 FL=1